MTDEKSVVADKDVQAEKFGLEVMVDEYACAVADQQAPPTGVEATRRFYKRYALRQEAMAGVGEEPACGKGCSYCCHTRVSAPAQEVFVLADAIGRLPPERAAEVRARVSANAARAEGMDAATHSRTPMPCAFLDEQGACSVYDDRPSNCRRYHSLSKADCEKSFSRPEDLTSRIRLNTSLLVANVSSYLGYRKVLVESAVDTSFFELNSALREALADPEACRERFDAGQPAFTDATVCVPNGTMI
ncbi:YkgJ family cysteine cluster protein [Aquincola sp. S2]|uniref:YkgJ family cysteine cluster protein n=1 Tax=Pseudaquabacterium terrae TaxID=2732868 RepID=A0ABX2EIN5_9BURK|nr:YkgJ family cysteine cluster protein [Aquabacterium terrae]NRF68496.1 YkgJ family cysteine cluster protein [Aquabacterium terrae]